VAHPEATEVMMRFLSEVETEDGRRISFKDYEAPKKLRLRLVIKLPADDEDLNQRVSIGRKARTKDR
jgi:hypothetical protein